MNEWDVRFLRLARHIAGWSKDRSRKVGCVIVDSHNIVRSIGYNGFPRGVFDEVASRHERPAKYQWTEHAERNAIYNASRIGVSLEGCRMYVPWFPCVDCARAIVQAGLAELIAFRPDLSDERWGSDFAIGLEMLGEAGVAIRFVDENMLEDGEA